MRFQIWSKLEKILERIPKLLINAPETIIKPVQMNSTEIPEPDGLDNQTLVKRKKRSINVVLPQYEEIEAGPAACTKPSLFRWAVESFNRYLYPPEDKLKKAPLIFKKIVVIGVHGWFPSKLLNRVLGEPVGTSDYIAAKMLKAISEHCNINNIEFSNDMVNVICLEKQGKIQERVDSHWEHLNTEPCKQLISNADLVIVTAHSQGTPVSAILLSKMINERFVDPKVQRLGILAMAGISHGPYPQLKSSIVIKYMEADPAKQLFDFNDPFSEVSKEYYDCMSNILHSGVRFVAIGSWYDQVVPLYSATVQGLSHPNIYRALYIDRTDYQPDFLSHLVVFALKLRNYGLSDHGLILYLSETLQGNIYGFGTQGHSAIYEEDGTYSVGLSWILAKSQFWDVHSKGTVVSHPPLQALTKTNPYFLPWIMARLLADTEITNHQDVKDDLERIIALFLAWVPTHGHLKDLKYRLEPLKSKL
jgi:hypothetical protein